MRTAKFFKKSSPRFVKVGLKLHSSFRTFECLVNFVLLLITTQKPVILKSANVFLLCLHNTLVGPSLEILQHTLRNFYSSGNLYFRHCISRNDDYLKFRPNIFPTCNKFSEAVCEIIKGAKA
jgi:hypothetical protein